jgi:hypothetical protein
MPINQINWLAVIIGGLIPMGVGMLWYSPMLFAKKWMSLVGKTEKEIREQGVTKAYALSFVTSLIMAFVLEYFVMYTGSFTVSSGIKLGFIIWAGFIATASYSSVLFEGRPNALYMINAGYYLVSLLIMGAVQGGMTADPMG